MSIIKVCIINDIYDTGVGASGMWQQSLTLLVPELGLNRELFMNIFITTDPLYVPKQTSTTRNV